MKTKSKPSFFNKIHNSQVLFGVARRWGVKLGSSSSAQQSTSKAAASNSAPIAGDMSRGRSSVSTSAHARPVEIPDPEDILKPSVDLKKKPKGIIRKIKYFPASVKKFYYQLNPPLTPEQLEGRDLLRQKIAAEKLIKKEAHVYEGKGSRKFAQLGERELLASPDPNKPKKVKMVKWDLSTWDENYTKIVLSLRTDPKYLPAYVRAAQLAKDPDFADDMMTALGHYVKLEADEVAVRMTVYRHGRDELPESITVKEVWKDFPQNKPLYTFPVGVGDNSSHHYHDPTEYPHTLICGGTGYGKSNMVNSIICWYLYRGLKPSELQFILFDLKRGVEFASYEGLPHLFRDETIPTGIVEELQDVLPTLYHLQEIRDQRLDLIKKAGLRNFQEYNWSRKPEKRLPALLLIFDEWARIRLTSELVGARAAPGTSLLRLARESVGPVLEAAPDQEKVLEIQKDYGTKVLKSRAPKHFGLLCENVLSEFTNLSRAAGIFVIVGTQHASKEIIGGAIKTNFPSMIVFNCSAGGSMAALANHSAFGLGIKGRAIFQNQDGETRVQTPLISTSYISGVVHAAIAGKPITLGHLGRLGAGGVGMEEILLYALHNLDGDLDYHKLFELFKTKGVRRNWLISELKTLENKEINLGGANYEVKPPGYHKPRRLKRL
jgi:hypothetical protein